MKVLIAANNAMFHTTLNEIFKKEINFSLIMHTFEAKSTINTFEYFKPDLLIMQNDFDTMDAFALISLIRQNDMDVKTIVVSYLNSYYEHKIAKDNQITLLNEIPTFDIINNIMETIVQSNHRYYNENIY
jgi:chemotaxis response regulator CheB